MMTILKSFVCAIVAIGLAAPSPSGATTNPVRSITVSYADLDLGSEKHVHRLERRIERAVRRLCGSYAAASNMMEMDAIDKCRIEAQHSIAPQLARALEKVETRLASTR